MPKTPSKCRAEAKRNRSPNGVGSEKRVNIALYPEERAEVERLAVLDNRSTSAMARLFILRGMTTDPNFNPVALRPTSVADEEETN